MDEKRYEPHIVVHKLKNGKRKVDEFSDLNEALEVFQYYRGKKNIDTVILAKRIRKSVW